MKKILLLVFVLVSFMSIAQPVSYHLLSNPQAILSEVDNPLLTGNQTIMTSPEDQLVDSLHVWTWHTQNEGWDYNSKSIDIVYDNNKNILLELNMAWDGTQYVNSYQYNYTYDENQNLLSKMYQTWNDIAWSNQYLFSYTYDNDNNEVSFFWKSGEDTSWINYLLYEYTYDTNMKITLVKSWVIDEWVPQARWFYYYNENNLLDDGFVQQWKNETWVDDDKYLFTYDTNNNLLNFLTLTIKNEGWENLHQWIYTYDSFNNPIYSLYQRWDENNWENYWQYSDNYDINHNLLRSDRKTWNGNSWRNRDRLINTYDNDNFKSSESYIKWNDSGSNIISGDSTYYYPLLNFGINDEPESRHEIIIYPNPGDGHCTICSLSPISSVEIYNVDGKLVYFDPMTNQTTILNINLSKLDKGIYFLRSYREAKQFTGKIIIQ